MPPKILVVDDDDLVLDLAYDALSAEFDVLIASSPSEALSLAAGQRFAVICSDYSMPDMTGVALLEKLKAGDPEARSVLLTGSDREAAKTSRHAFAVLDKPFRPSQLRALVSALSTGDIARAREIADQWNVQRPAKRASS